MRYIPRGSKGFPKVTKHQRAENFEEQMQKEFRHITCTKMKFALFIFPRISSRKEKKLVTLPFESKKNSSKYQKNFVIPPTFLYIHSLFLPSTTEQFCVLTPPPPPAPHICTFFCLSHFLRLRGDPTAWTPLQRVTWRKFSALWERVVWENYDKVWILQKPKVVWTSKFPATSILSLTGGADLAVSGLY